MQTSEKNGKRSCNANFRDFMKVENLINKLGKPIQSEGLEKMIKDLGCFLPPKTELDSQGNKYFASSYNDSANIVLNFVGLNRFRPTFGEPLEDMDSSKDALVLTKIRFNNLTKLSDFLPNIELPFGLEKGLTVNKVKDLLKVKPYTTSKIYRAGKFQIFDYGVFQMWATFDRFDELEKLEFYYFEKSEKAKLELKRSLQAQKKNILPANVDHVNEYLEKFPTQYWNYSQRNGNNPLEEINTELTDFVHILAKYTTKKNAAGIYNSVKKLVTKINKISAKNSGLIETMERENLCNFIGSVVKSTGFKIDDGIDLTEDWREW